MLRAVPRARLAPLLALLLALAGCGDALAPADFPPGMTRFDAPPVYAEWWRDVERCSGLTGDPARVEWYYLPGAEQFEYRGGSYGGYWWEYRHTILLAESLKGAGTVVRHEMLHDLLNSGEHPPEYFTERCAGIVR